MKCNRYIFSYTSSPEEVESFILRSANLAEQTYGRDVYFARLNQVINQARFLGWNLPRFGPGDIPDDFTEIPPEGIDHIFELQAKLLVDVAPVTRVALVNGDYCPVKMVCGTTAAGDLVWKCHLLSDKEGMPYVRKQGKELKAKTRGTKIACQSESLPYEENYLFECFGGEDEGIWPMPFLPEFFSDQPIARKFSPSVDVVEVVNIDEEEPVRVLARGLVPWYRAIHIDKTKALAYDDYEPSGFGGAPRAGFDPTTLVSGWDDISEDEQIDLEDEDEDGDYEEDDSDTAQLINMITKLSEKEVAHFEDCVQILETSNIASKKEAEELRKDPKHKERAENWLLTAVNKLRLVANYEQKIGALVSILNKHQGQQILVLQPRQKWAEKLTQVLKSRGFDAHFVSEENSKALLRDFYDGECDIVVTASPTEKLFIDEVVIISVSSFSPIKWLDWLNPSHLVYNIVVERFGLSDHNLVPEHPNVLVQTEKYSGPGLDILKLEEIKTKAKPITKKPTKKKPKFKVKIQGSKGRPKTASSYEKAMEIAKKFEADSKKVEVFGPDNDKDVLYSTGMPKILQGELE